ncbi:MAG: hypothetical protein LBT06_19460 [Hungatella sp.]|nr:hypothetical protein [Hungatella sp.]
MEFKMKKKLSVLLLSGTMAFALVTSVYAQEPNYIGVMESSAVDTKLPIGDESITQNVIDVGNSYANQMSGNVNTRADGEVWTLESTTTVIPYGAVKGSFGDIIPEGESKTKTCSWSISAGTDVRNYKISASVSGSKSITQSGPTASTKLADGKNATHRSFFVVGYGKLVKYDYKVTQKYSGNFLRRETKYMFADVSTESCSQLIRLDGSTVNAQNLNGSKVTSAGSLQNYKNQFYKTDGTCLKYYKF